MAKSTLRIRKLALVAGGALAGSPGRVSADASLPDATASGLLGRAGDRHRVDPYFVERAVAVVGPRLLDLVDDVHAGADATEDGVQAIEPRAGIRGHDEELRAVRVRARIRHREHAALDPVLVRFVSELVAGPAGTRACRIPALNHEVRDHPVEDHPVVEALAGERDEVRHCLGRVVVEQFDLDRALVSGERHRRHGADRTPRGASRVRSGRRSLELPRGVGQPPRRAEALRAERDEEGAKDGGLARRWDCIPTAAEIDRFAGAGSTAIRLWRALAVVGFGLLVAHLGTGLGGRGLDHFADRWLSDGLELLAGSGCLLRALLVRHERLAWSALGIGIVSFALGDVCFDFVYGGAPPIPSLADVFYLSFYPCCCVALALLFKSRVSSFDRSLWLDGLMAALASAAVSASVVLEVVLRNTHGAIGTVAVNLAYPVADLVLLALVVFVFAVSGFRPGRTWATVGGAFAVMAVADGLYLYLTATGRYGEGSLLDALWPAAMLLLAASAWQSVEREAHVELEARLLAGPPIVCGMVALGVLVDNRFEPHNLIADSLAAATVLVVLARLTLTFHDNLRLLERARAQSLTDDLTGLANRRSLILDLERETGVSPPKPMLLAIFDLNGFKLYNDTFGHPGGDELLDRLAARLARAVRPEGKAYRLGGDEFCVRVPPAF